MLDRTKEPGSLGEPLYQDVVTAMAEAFAEGTPPFAQQPRIVGGRYGLSSKEFTPAMVKASSTSSRIRSPKNHFTIGIDDDVTHTSLPYDPEFSTESPRTVRALFYGLGSDGTVGANKNSIKIIGSQTENYAQGYFVYDSKKSGSITTSHLRFGPEPINSTYLITKANFVACHQFSFLERMDVLVAAAPGAVFLLNTPFGPEEIWSHLPRKMQATILEKKLQFYVIDGYAVARAAGMGNRINTIMQTCFFAISGVLPREEAIEQIKKAIKKTYGKRGDAVVQQNFAAVDAALAHLHKVDVPAAVSATFDILPAFPDAAPAFVRDVLGDDCGGFRRRSSSKRAAGRRNLPDGHGAMGEAEYRTTDSGVGQGALYPVRQMRDGLPSRRDSRQSLRAVASWSTRRRPSRLQSQMERHGAGVIQLQVAPEDCTGCRLCVEICPVKSKSEAKHKALNMEMQAPLRNCREAELGFL